MVFLECKRKTLSYSILEVSVFFLPLLYVPTIIGMASALGLSIRGVGNVDAILDKISGAIEERAKKDNNNIDLGTSENWLMREEVIQICKNAIQSNLMMKVSRWPHTSMPRKPHRPPP
jgi:hypothetical protein